MGNFVDHVKITAKAGNGGNGSMSFPREKFVLNGGPLGANAPALAPSKVHRPMYHSLQCAMVN